MTLETRATAKQIREFQRRIAAAEKLAEEYRKQLSETTPFVQAQEARCIRAERERDKALEELEHALGTITKLNKQLYEEENPNA